LICSQCGKPEQVWRDRNLREAQLFSDDSRSCGQGALKKIDQGFNRSAGVLKFGLGDLATDRAAMDIPIEPSGRRSACLRSSASLQRLRSFGRMYRTMVSLTIAENLSSHA
jgi:hypothetical protein